VSRDYRLYLDDMLESARKILSYTQGMGLDQFKASELVRDAVVFNLQIIGEAASHVPAEVRARYPEVKWHRMVGLRNVIAHGYFVLVHERIWETIQRDLPALPGQVERILAEWPEP